MPRSSAAATAVPVLCSLEESTVTVPGVGGPQCEPKGSSVVGIDTPTHTHLVAEAAELDLTSFATWQSGQCGHAAPQWRMR